MTFCSAAPSRYYYVDETARYRYSDIVTIFAFDRATARRIDVDGRMHVSVSNISKAGVNPYYGHEIPNNAALGLAPDRVYWLLRHPDELAKAVDTFNNIQLLDVHVPVNADDPQKESIAGSTGTDAAYVHPYMQNSLVIWDQAAIDDVVAERKKELSSSYRYTADMTPGYYEGLRFDGIMRNIIANHVALVEKGRAGPDVMVNDQRLESPVMLKSRRALMLHGAVMALAIPKLAADAAVDLSPLLEGVTDANIKERRDTIVSQVVTAIGPKLAADQTLDAAEVGALVDTVTRVTLAADEDVIADPVTPPAPVVPPVVTTPPAPAAQKDEPTVITQAAMDAAIHAATTAQSERFNAIRQAERDVQPVFGDVKVAVDSAADVYKLALDHMGVDLTGVAKDSYAGMFKALSAAQEKVATVPAARRFASDAATTPKVVEMFPNAVKLR